MFLTLLGACLAVALPCIGSSKGVGVASEAANGLTSREPDKFGKLLVLQLLAGTQGLYGFIISIMIILKTGILGGMVVKSARIGALYLCASIAMALGGFFSAIYQGRVCATGIQIIAKQPKDSSKAIVSASLVELYALLSFIISFLIIINIGKVEKILEKLIQKI